MHEQLDLVLRDELRLVNYHAVVGREVHGRKILDKDALRLESATAPHDLRTITALKLRLGHEHLLPSLDVVVPHHDGVRRLARAHRAIAVIEFGHFFASS